jgi:hypothetical protein
MYGALISSHILFILPEQTPKNLGLYIPAQSGGGFMLERMFILNYNA